MITQPNPYEGNRVYSVKIKDITFYDPSTNLTNNKKEILISKESSGLMEYCM